MSHKSHCKKCTDTKLYPKTSLCGQCLKNEKEDKKK